MAVGSCTKYQNSGPRGTIFRKIPQARAMQSITRAAWEEISRCHSHHTPTRGAPTARPGFSQKASTTLPCSRASTMRWAPQKGQSNPVSQWRGQVSIFTDLRIYGFSAAKLHFIHQMAKKKPKNVSEIGRLTCFCHNYARQSEQRDKVGDSHETIEQVGYVPDDVQLNDGSDKDGSDVEHPI